MATEKVTGNTESPKSDVELRGCAGDSGFRHGITRCLDCIAGWYDSLLKLAGRTEGKFRQRCIHLASLKGGEDVLDAGCGTGSLPMALARRLNSGEVFGCDISPGMIDIAKEKSEQAGLRIDYKVASITNLPYGDDTFDVVFTNIMFHHLNVDEKKGAVSEVHRVLKPGGTYISAEFGPQAKNRIQRLMAMGEWTLYPEHLIDAGFTIEQESLERSIWLKRVIFRVARKPGGGPAKRNDADVSVDEWSTEPY